MIITQFDTPTTAEEARRISLANKEDSEDRRMFRTIMQRIMMQASFGHTRYKSPPMTKDQNPSEHVCEVLQSLGYKTTIKRAYQFDEETGDWSDRPLLGPSGRELSFFEITWG